MIGEGGSLAFLHTMSPATLTVSQCHSYTRTLLLRLSPLLVPRVPDTVRKSQVLREEVLSEVIKLAVFCTQPIRSSDATHAGQLMHVLLKATGQQSGHPVLNIIEGMGWGLTTSVHDPANNVLFLPLMNIISGTTLR